MSSPAPGHTRHVDHTDPGTPEDRRLEEAILDLIGRRAPGATICPSEAARAVGGEEHWRDLMEPARQAAQRLTVSGEVEVTQGGEVVDLATARGPVRVRRASRD